MVGDVDRKVDNRIEVILEAWERSFGHNQEKVLKSTLEDARRLKQDF